MVMIVSVKRLKPQMHRYVCVMHFINIQNRRSWLENKRDSVPTAWSLALTLPAEKTSENERPSSVRELPRVYRLCRILQDHSLLFYLYEHVYSPRKTSTNLIYPSSLKFTKYCISRRSSDSSFALVPYS